jgi:hypothetical protein
MGLRLRCLCGKRMCMLSKGFLRLRRGFGRLGRGGRGSCGAGGRCKGRGGRGMLLVLWLLGMVLVGKVSICSHIFEMFTSRDACRFQTLSLGTFMSKLHEGRVRLTSPNKIRTPPSPRPRALRSQPRIDRSHAQRERVVIRIFRVVCVESIWNQIRD